MPFFLREVVRSFQPTTVQGGVSDLAGSQLPCLQ